MIAPRTGSDQEASPAAFDRYPALIARCTSTQDAATAVRLARQHDLPIAVRSGRHSHAGLKAAYDPGNIFRLNHNIEPGDFAGS